MKKTTAKILIKLACYTLVALWFIKKWYLYIYKGHLLYDVKSLIHRRPNDETCGVLAPGHLEVVSGRDGEECRVFSRELEELDLEYVEPIEKGCCAIDYVTGYQGEQIEIKTWNCRNGKEKMYKDDLYNAELEPPFDPEDYMRKTLD